ncbi:MAG: FAD-dependent oxidoreductase, partial [Oscillospiraceae bacterium]|nr:FAD-dependent oxidoreductase [Oscillospiraceae bacterium]
MYDVVVLGAGVVGCAIARELSRYALSVCVLERAEDVCCGTSKSNSAIIHAGFDAKPGSNKAKYNLRGNAMMDRLSQELDIPFRRNGSLVLCFSQEEMPRLRELYERGVQNGVPGLELLTGEQVRAMEHAVSGEVVGALHAPSGGIV